MTSGKSDDLNCVKTGTAPLIAARQPQHEVPDDVALHLGGASLDGVAAGAQVAVRPGAVIDRVRIVLFSPELLEVFESALQRELRAP